MYRTIFFIALLLQALAGGASAAAWDKSLDVSLGASSNLTRIYVDGQLKEKRSSSLDLHLDGSLNRNGADASWKNSLKIDYSGSRTSDRTNPYNAPKWTENSDQLIADSVYRRHAGFFADPYGGLNVQTAVFDSHFPGEWEAFRPLQLRESAGLSLPITTGAGNEFTFRLGYFYQHYVNRGGADRDPSHGVETVLEFDGNLAKNIALKSKAGLYTGLAETDDMDNPISQSRKNVLEWDNRMVISLTKLLSINIILNIDNRDISSDEISYEIDHRTELAVDWKVF
jgi:hypothetical protein